MVETFVEWGLRLPTSKTAHLTLNGSNVGFCGVFASFELATAAGFKCCTKCLRKYAARRAATDELVGAIREDGVKR